MVLRATFLFFTLLIFSASDSAAIHPVDAVSAAVKVVEDFSESEMSLLKDLEGVPEAGLLSLQKRLSGRTLETKAGIKETGWSEGPGPRRFSRVYRMVDRYTLDQIDMIKAYAERSGLSDSPSYKRLMKELTKARKGALKELSEARRFEVPEDKRHRPVPIIDRSPFEQDKQGGKGIWDR